MTDRYSIIYNKYGPSGIKWLNEETNTYDDIMIGDTFKIKGRVGNKTVITRIKYKDKFLDESTCTLLNIERPDPYNNITISYSIDGMDGDSIINYLRFDKYGCSSCLGGERVKYILEKINNKKTTQEQKDLEYKEIEIYDLIKDAKTIKIINALRNVYVKIKELESILDNYQEKSYMHGYDYVALFKDIDGVLTSLSYIKYNDLFDDTYQYMNNTISENESQNIYEILHLLSDLEQYIYEIKSEMKEKYNLNDIEKSFEVTIKTIQCHRINISKAFTEENVLGNKIILARELMSAYIYIVSVYKQRNLVSCGENILDYIILFIYNFIINRIDESVINIITNKE